MIEVTRHALEQARERTHVIDFATIATEVREALEEGRTSAARPRFLGAGAPAREDGLFAWPPSEDHAYVVRPVNGDRDAWAVVTVITPPPTAMRAAFERAGVAA